MVLMCENKNNYIHACCLTKSLITVQFEDMTLYTLKKLVEIVL